MFDGLQNGKFAVVGSYDGRCVFYTTEQLKYYTQIHVRSTRGRNSKGRKITGIESLPNEDKVDTQFIGILTDYECKKIDFRSLMIDKLLCIYDWFILFY